MAELGWNPARMVKKSNVKATTVKYVDYLYRRQSRKCQSSKT